MIERADGEQPGAGLSSTDLAGWVEQLGVMDVRVDDAGLIDRIGELERVKSACAAAQAELTVAFVGSQTVGLSTKRARDERTRRGVSAQVALARRDSPFRGGRHVGLARILTSEMPNVFAALRSKYLIARDQTCRGPFYDAPIRHADHVVSHENGGPTRTVNGQGLCERCNYIKPKLRRFGGVM